MQRHQACWKLLKTIVSKLQRISTAFRWPSHLKQSIYKIEVATYFKGTRSHWSDLFDVIMYSTDSYDAIHRAGKFSLLPDRAAQLLAAGDGRWLSITRRPKLSSRKNYGNTRKIKRYCRGIWRHYSTSIYFWTSTDRSRMPLGCIITMLNAKVCLSSNQRCNSR